MVTFIDAIMYSATHKTTTSKPVHSQAPRGPPPTSQFMAPLLTVIGVLLGTMATVNKSKSTYFDQLKEEKKHLQMRGGGEEEKQVHQVQGLFSKKLVLMLIIPILN